MTADRWSRIGRLFESALEVDVGEREAFLRERCGADHDLLDEVMTLLAVEGPGSDYFARLAERMRPRPTPGRESFFRPRSRIGRWRLVRPLGRGGMGVVYLAERDDGQFDRRVAIKLLRASPETDELHRRFRSERKILASLAHPNVARLFDGGLTEHGLPFLVMEYVEGRRITDYCDRRGLDLGARLRLFRDVCSAVQHAHSNLVIHRDLKPANILVTGDGTVKLLDFGIAKLLEADADGTDADPTRTDQRVLTPRYASPEQLRGGSLTTASDVYALGLVLYELLTGTPAFPAARRRRSPAELLEDRDPEPPSHRVSRARARNGHVPTASGAADPGTDDGNAEGAVARVAAACGTSVGRLGRRLRGDLDGIVMMALERDPRRRYGSAELLAEDLGRFLAGRPVRARRRTRAYALRKFVRRHRTETAAAILMAALLGTAGVVVARQGATAVRERDRARQALDESRELANLLIGLFEAGDPAEGGERVVVADELLRLGAVRAEALADRPLLRARMLDAIGRAWMNLARYDEAEPLLERALALRRAERSGDHPEVAESVAALAALLARTGRLQEARSLYERALTLQRRHLGARHETVATTLLGLASVEVVADLDRATALTREALEIRRAALGPDHALVAQALERLSQAIRRAGGYTAAEELQREAVDVREHALGPTHPAVATATFHLADVIRGDPARQGEAEATYRRGLSILGGGDGPLRPTAVHGLHNLAELVSARGDHTGAERLLEDALAVQRRTFGPESKAAAETLGKLAAELLVQGRLDEAERLHRESLRLFQRVLGPDHPAAAGAMTSLAHVLALRRADGEAEALHHRALEIRETRLGTDAVATAISRILLGDLYRFQGRYRSAEALLRTGLEILQARLGEASYTTRAARERLAVLYEEWGQRAEARRHRLLAGKEPVADWPRLPARPAHAARDGPATTPRAGPGRS